MISNYNTRKIDEENLATGLMVISPFVMIVVILVRAFVLSSLWNWYAVSFFDAKIMPVSIAFGLNLIVGYFILPITVMMKDERTINQKILGAILYPLVFLLFGWVGSKFI